MKKLRILWMVIKRSDVDKIVMGFLISFFVIPILLSLREPEINGYFNALWYMFVACTSIGFGDLVPVTALGRLLTVYITIYEIVIVSVIPGVVASYYLEVIHRREKETVSVFMDKLEHLPELSTRELADLSAQIKKLKN